MGTILRYVQVKISNERRANTMIKYVWGTLLTEFFKLGCTLYNEDRESNKIRFYQADMLDPHFAQKNIDIQYKFDFVHTANVIHLFDRREQELFFSVT